MRTIFFTFLLSITLSSWAQQAKTHAIDVWLEKAIEKDSSTVGMRAATNRAREMWDKEMNQIYARLMGRLSKEQQASLRDAQRSWLRYRDAEGKAISDIIASKDGTIWQLSATGHSMELVRTRALQLKAYEDATEE
jgi:uncharacterized protein YecT (DUF1311 family)